VVQVRDLNKDVLTIVTVYRSPSSANDNNLALCSLLEELTNRFASGKLMIAGDFNIVNIDWSDCRIRGSSSAGSFVSSFLRCVQSKFLIQNVVKPTRIRGVQIPHILDLIFTNDDFVDGIEYLSPLGKSDHCVLSVTCNISAQSSRGHKKLNLDKGDYKSLNAFISNTLNVNEQYLSGSSVEELWNDLKSIIITGADKFIPTVQPSLWKKKKTWAYPVSSVLKKLINKKHRLWTRFQETRDNKFLIEYKHVRNLVRKETRLVCQSKQLEIAKSCKKNPKKFWQFVKGKTSTVSGIGDLKKINGTDCTTVKDDQEKAEMFSEFFYSIYTDEPLDYFDPLLPRSVSSPMLPISVTELIVAKNSTS
jgi:hypothetical protein